MKVSTLIDILERYYTKDDYIVVAWWDKDWAESDLDRKFTADEWEELATSTEIATDWIAEAVSTAFQDALDIMEEDD